MSSLDALRAALIVPDEALFAEFIASVGAMRMHHFDWCRAHGIGDEALFSGPSLCGAARVELVDDDTYRPAKGGEPAIIVAVGEFDEDGWHEISDLVAYRPSSPHQWALRRRDESILGRQTLEYARDAYPPARLFASPHEWLANGGAGVTVIDWSAALSWPFRGAHVLADDPALAERLDHAIETELARLRPDIRIARKVIDAAA